MVFLILALLASPNLGQDLVQEGDPFPHDWAGYARFASLPTSFLSANKTYKLAIDFKTQRLSLQNTERQSVVWSQPWPENGSPTCAIITDDGTRTLLYNLVKWHPGDLFVPDSPEVLYILNGSGGIVDHYSANRIDLGKGLVPLDDGAGDQTGLTNARLDVRKGTFMANFLANAAPYGQSRPTFAQIAFDIRSGAQVPVSETDRQRLNDELRTLTQQQYESAKDDQSRVWILQNAAALGERWAVPELLKLLDDPHSNGTGSTDGKEFGPLHTNQYMAGRGLARLDKSLAAPLLQRKLSLVKDTNEQMEWLRVLGEAGTAPDKNTAIRLASCKDYLVRFCLLDSLKNSHATYAAECARITLAFRDTRWNAFEILKDQGDARDALSAERLMNDIDVNWTAIATLTKYGSDATLEKFAKKSKGDGHWEALIELAKRNNPWALKTLVSTMELAARQPAAYDKFLEQFEQASKVIVLRQPKGGVAALERIVTTDPAYWWADIYASMALIQLGQGQRSDYLRAIAAGHPPKGAPHRRYNNLGIDMDGKETALRCLAELGDTSSIPLSRKWAQTHDTFQILVGKEALNTIGADIQPPAIP